MTVNSDDLELAQMGGEWVLILAETKNKLLKVFDKYNLDNAYFDVEIFLKIDVDGQVIISKEKWKSMGFGG